MKVRLSEEDAAFRETLRLTRQAAGLTQVQAAKRLGVKQSFISKCESGERRVDAVELTEFCRAYGLSVSKFFSAMRKRNAHRRAK
jgi:transcriptional regulator with XRE-family HTH domain